jgi:hypothetical protein
MKNIIRLSLIALTGSLLLAGCTKKPVARTTSTHFISATISGGGTFYTSDPNIHTGGSVGGNLKIDGIVTGVNKELEIWFLAYPGAVGSYNLDGVNQGGIYVATIPDAAASSVHGTVIFTAVTPDCIGTFNFTRMDSSVVSGSFNVPAP